MNSTPWWPADQADSPNQRLSLIGWDAEWEAQFAPFAAQDLRPARVARVDRGVVTLLAAADTVRARLASRDLEPAVGDWVAFESPTSQSDPLVRALLPRRGEFVRHAAGEQSARQVVAANIDHVFVVNSLDQRVSPRRIERYLALAWSSGASPVIVLTKTDLAEDLERDLGEVAAVAGGVPVHAVSVITGEGLDQLDGYHEASRTVALVGPSGAGKSTLINRLLGEERMATGGVRKGDHKGRHTTTHRELVPMPGGGILVDSPGMRTVGLWEGDEGLEQAFADVEALAAQCKFSDCTHTHEPGCAVIAAVQSGELTAERLASYDALQAELEHQRVKADARLQSERRKQWRIMTKANRQDQKYKQR